MVTYNFTTTIALFTNNQPLLGPTNWQFPSAAGDLCRGLHLSLPGPLVEFHLGTLVYFHRNL